MRSGIFLDLEIYIDYDTAIFLYTNERPFSIDVCAYTPTRNRPYTDILLLNTKQVKQHYKTSDETSLDLDSCFDLH